MAALSQVSLIANSFRPLLGLPCWGLRFDGNTGLWLQFGPPHLRIQEPRVIRSGSARVRRLLSHRLVTVSGRWTLAIFCGRWRLKLQKRSSVSQSTSYERIRVAIALLDGQKLKQLEVKSLRGHTVLEFDLGAVLEVKGSDCDDGEMWTLYKPQNYALSIRQTGEYSHGPASRESKWRAIRDVSNRGHR